MLIDLAGKLAVVTGGSNGIGSAMVKCLTECRAETWVFDVEPCDIPEARVLNVDVTSRPALERAFDQCGAPDIVMINAGTSVVTPFLQTTREQWDRTLSLNLTAAFETLQAAALRMKTRGGAIVLTASTNSYDGEENLIAYNASKAGILGLLHTAANELGPYGIRVNAINPGLIRTRLTASAFNDEEAIRAYFRDVPLGRGGEPMEVAHAAVFLASDLASYITGAALLIDGGQMAAKFGTWSEAKAEFREGRWKLRD